MTKVEEARTRIIAILRNYAEIFSNVESETDLVERFRNSFPTKRSYWSHVFRHAVPRKVLVKYGITNWKEAMMHSEVILPYQVEYAKIALRLFEKSSDANFSLKTSKKRYNQQK